MISTLCCADIQSTLPQISPFNIAVFLICSQDEPSSRLAHYDSIDASSHDHHEREPKDTSIESTFTEFFHSTMGALALGIMAGSLTVFVVMKVYKALK